MHFEIRPSSVRRGETRRGILEGDMQFGLIN